MKIINHPISVRFLPPLFTDSTPALVSVQSSLAARMPYFMTARSITASENGVENPKLVSFFRNLSDVANEYLAYENDYTVNDMYDEGFRAFQDITNAADAFLNHCVSFYNMPDVKASRELSNAGMAFLSFEPRKTAVELEFLEMARAGMAYIKHPFEFEPMDPCYHKLLPHTLQVVYRHMGYPPINELWDEFCDPICADWTHDDWSCECGKRTVDFTTIDITACRDVPKAVVYMHQSTNGLEPIEVIASRYMAEAADCLGYENDFDDWNDELVAAFRDVSQAAIGAVSYVWVPPDYFPRFLELPPELRANIMHEYLLLERDAGRLSIHRHFDEWNNPCCLWDYPNVLIACDHQDPTVFPNAGTARCPKGWLPMLAFTSKPMLGEIVVQMLQRTERIDLKYMYNNISFKIATWLRTFLEAIPDGMHAVKYLNFPHMHWFNHNRNPPALYNASVELAVACTNLRKIDMTFHVEKVTKRHEETGVLVPLTSQEMVSRFRLWTILDCENLQEIYFDGIYVSPSRGGRTTDLDALEDLGKWFMKGFLVRRDGKNGIQIEVVRRWGKWQGRVAGDMVVLDKDELAEVEMGLAIKRGEMDVSTQHLARCAYPPIM